MQIASLKTEHLEDAARLFATRYHQERERVPALPRRHEDERGVLPMLTDLLGRCPGVAAVEGDQLRGYLIGLPIPEFKGSERGVLSPIWASAADGDRRAETYRRMYERISRQWVRAGCLTHAITLYAGDGEGTDVWFRNGFGLLVVDALRPASPVEVPPSAEAEDVKIERVGSEGVDLVLPLVEALDRYMADGPIFLPYMEKASRSEWAEWLGKPGHSLWLAVHRGRAIGYMRCQPPSFDVALVVTDPGTVSITGAYVQPEWRSKGIASRLLGRLVESVKAEGYERVAVDFESANIYGSRFWLSHFEPICHSLIRRVDERIAWAHKDRSADSLW